MVATASARRIRIAYVIDTLSVPAGGTEQQLLALLDGLDPQRFDPHVFCLRSSAWLASEGRDLPTTDLDIHFGVSPVLPARIRRFAEVLRRGHFDVVQTHFRDGNIVGILAASQAGVRAILSTRRGVPYWRSPVGLWFLRRLNRRVTRFIANSRATKQHYVQAEHLPDDRVDVIYNGIELERFRSAQPGSGPQLRAELGIAADAPIVGIVANLRPVKGIADLLHAARPVLDAHPRTHFVVVGQGPEEAALRATVDALHLGENVHLVGARSDVPELLQTFDIGVLASHFESFSNSILEYRAAGLPVVVTDVGGAREVVRDGFGGFVVPPRAPEIMAQRLCELLDRAEGPRAWAKNFELAPQFQMTNMVHAYEDLYEECVLAGDDR